MTKSGIGTSILASQNQSFSISNAEIPIWVADKKKWVTGISKKTTINDLIYAILKQCQLVQVADSSNENILEQIANQYVLVEYQFESKNDLNKTLPIENSPIIQHNQQQPQLYLSSQRILNGDSKVYKLLNTWAQSPSFNNPQQQNQSMNLMLKILKKESTNSNGSPSSSQIENSDFLNTYDQVTSNATNNNNSNSSSSLATKLLKKFGVSSSTSHSYSNNLNTNLNKTPTNTNNLTANSNALFRYVDVKLPTTINNSSSLPNKSSNFSSITLQSPCTLSNSFQGNTSNNNVSTNFNTNIITTAANNGNNNSNNISSNSPLNNSTVSSVISNNKHHLIGNNQKKILFNSIFEKEVKLKQQIEKFKLLDEMIKETEKTSKQNKHVTNLTILNQLADVYSNSQIANDINDQQNIDLNDIYCHFPEMCTHHLKEVEDFTTMCCQLFQLEESIKLQKQVLNSLEYDLQLELNQQNNNNTSTLSKQVSNILQQNQQQETAETLELRKEVNMSREQTRIQCKQLHDLDLKMRQNEQSLLIKEHELQQLLEELYIQEIYAENSFTNTFMNTNNSLNTKHNQNSSIKVNNDENKNNELKKETPNFKKYKDDSSLLSSNSNSNLQQKSLSIGNLVGINKANSPINNITNKADNQANEKNNSKKSICLDVNLSVNKTTPTQVSLTNNDNDSGISSMSSETTPPSASSSQQIPIATVVAATATTASTTSSTSSSASSSSCSHNNNNNNNNPVIQSLQYNFNQQYINQSNQLRNSTQLQQHGKYVKQNSNNLTGNNVAKSVLETLV